MGSALAGCARRNSGAGGSLSDFGVPQSYEWDGLAEDRIDAYYDAKDKVIDELEKSLGSSINLNDASWAQQVSPNSKEMLKHLLLQRAISLVHVLRPIEEQRRSMRIMQQKGMLPDKHFASFESADETCQGELKSIIEESRALVPEAPPNAIIQAAVHAYNQQQDAAEAGEGGKSFEDVKRGFLQGAAKKPDKLIHGFEVGSDVMAHSLKTESMNGAIGKVKGAKGDRVAVTFPSPLGEKALKPENLKVAPIMPEIHPDAREPPSFNFHAELARQKGEDLGLSLEPIPKTPKPGQESFLRVTGILPDGYVKKYNESVKDPRLRLCPNDNIIGVVDCSVPEAKRKPVCGKSKQILEIIQTGRTPLVLLTRRVLGPPLRFVDGQRVMANCGDKGWLEGRIINVWDEGQGGNMVPYVIRLSPGGNVVFAPKDNDQYVKKADPLFKVGDAVMCHMQGSYKKATITEIKDLKVLTSYLAKVDKQVIEVPEELTSFVRPIARFTVGTEVLAKMQGGYVPGKIEAVYHPRWVYSVRLDEGDLVFVPEDVDNFVKKR
eukprot:TRINITY_DN51087_c0_g1_i1.p1 TRINITY_DN51087_c0_g1~~TRINITY_DN51087_c0_g1_i1.p1  ORF type:complete len:571 (-),score=105.75 TRINITY_DN51087_c0_g1_i1:85-1731(-)